MTWHDLPRRRSSARPRSAADRNGLISIGSAIWTGRHSHGGICWAAPSPEKDFPTLLDAAARTVAVCRFRPADCGSRPIGNGWTRLLSSDTAGLRAPAGERNDVPELWRRRGCRVVVIDEGVFADAAGSDGGGTAGDCDPAVGGTRRLWRTATTASGWPCADHRGAVEAIVDLCRAPRQWNGSASRRSAWRAFESSGWCATTKRSTTRLLAELAGPRKRRRKRL